MTEKKLVAFYELLHKEISLLAACTLNKYWPHATELYAFPIGNINKYNHSNYMAPLSLRTINSVLSILYRYYS